MPKHGKMCLMALSARDKSFRDTIGRLIARHLWAKILIGMALGTVTGLVLSPGGLGALSGEQAIVAAEWIALPGIIFLALLKMIIIPLIICSIVLGILTSGSLEELKQMGLRLVPYFITTTAIAVTAGIIIASSIQPGASVSSELVTSATTMAQENQPIQIFDDLSVPDRIVNLMPVNFIKAALNMDMLQIVIAAIILGVVCLTIPRETVRPFEALCTFGQVAAMKIIGWAMSLAPYAVFGLMADAMIRIGFGALGAIGAYILCVLGGLLFMLCVYLAIIHILARRSPLEFLRGIRDVQLLAFSTSSSAAVMPLSIRAAEENLHVKEEVSRFVIPLGATINMDGTAMYQAIAAIFLCQVFGVDLSLSETVLLILTTIGASIGTPATPGVGIVVLATILSGIGVPPAGIGIILGVDRLLDMCRTTVNVTGDLTATIVMDRWIGRRHQAPDKSITTRAD